MRLEEWTSPAGKRRILTQMEPHERRVYALALPIKKLLLDSATLCIRFRIRAIR